MNRWLVRICVFLILGAIVNVAVAWILVHLSRQFQADPVHSWTDDFSHFSPIQESDRQQLADFGWQYLTSAKLHLDIRTAVGVSLRIVTEDTGRYNITAFEESSAGWPCLALRGLRFNGSTPSARNDGQSAWVFQAAIPRPHGRQSQRLFNSQLPFRPLWPGFAINTVFYAVVLWLLFAVPFALRRWRRIRRGLCPKCAYPVGTSDVCTECGARVRQP